jgi:three-Cys-motif partner protein
MQLHRVNGMWKCINCGSTSAERPTFCRNCGLVQAGIGTHEKYQILENYCYPLSLIMRNNDIPHYFIDACAGSGKVQAYDKDVYLDGSPLIMAKTRDRVEEKIIDKTRTKHVRCIFIEINPKTRGLLEKWTCDYPNCEIIEGDCNRKLPNILDRLDSERWKPFAFIYVDPFGLGDPPIMMETLRRVLERNYTELFIQLSVDGLIRAAGWLKYRDSRDSVKRRKAQTFCETLGLVIGDDRIDEFCEKWLTWRQGDKEIKSLKYYISGLRNYFPHIEYVGIPIGSKSPVYYLIYTSRKLTGKKIMQGIITNAKRKGSETLERWFG